jgi:hypothetical protein
MDLHIASMRLWNIILLIALDYLSEHVIDHHFNSIVQTLDPEWIFAAVWTHDIWLGQGKMAHDIFNVVCQFLDARVVGSACS